MFRQHILDLIQIQNLNQRKCGFKNALESKRPCVSAEREHTSSHMFSFTEEIKGRTKQKILLTKLMQCALNCQQGRSVNQRLWAGLWAGDFRGSDSKTVATSCLMPSQESLSLSVFVLMNLAKKKKKAVPVRNH